MKTMIYIGVDPGKEGAVAWIKTGDQATCGVIDIPVIKPPGSKVATYDLVKCRDLIVKLACPILGKPQTPVMAAVEEQSVRPRQSAKSAKTIGHGEMLWLALFCAMGIGVDRPTPQSWKRAMGVKGDKHTSMAAAHSLYPYMRSQIIRHDHAEALLIAEYLKRTTGEI